MWQRFPVPEFDRDPFKDMDWQAPAYLSDAEAPGGAEEAVARHRLKLCR